MKQLLWKEIREITKWALLGLILFFIACFYALSTAGEESYSYNITFCHPTFLMVTSFGYSLFGIALACIQLIPEFSRDQWATLLHRPMARSRVLFAKVLVGLSVYMLCTLLPLAASVVYVTTPGNFAAPFTPPLLLPAISDWCVGLCFYALTLLMCLHKGKWIGSRGILAIAGAFIFIAHLLPYLPFSLPLFAFCVFMTASMGAITSGRVIKLRPRFTRGAFVIAVLIGSCGLLTLIFSGNDLLMRNSYSYMTAYRGFYITEDGIVLTSQPSKDLSKNFLFDPEGKNVTDQYDQSDRQKLRTLFSYAYRSWYSNKKRPYFFTRYSSALVEPLQLGMNDRERWYYLSNRNYAIGYDRVTKQCLGIIDHSGFHSEKAPLQPFPENSEVIRGSSSGDGTFYLKTPTEIFDVNLLDRSVTPFYKIEGPDLFGFMGFGFDMQNPQFFVAALENEIQILDRSGKKLFAIPYAYDIEQWGYLSIATDKSANRFFFGYQPLFSRAGKPLPQYLVVTDNTGHTLHQYELPDEAVIKPSLWKRLPKILSAPPAIQTWNYLRKSDLTYFQSLLFTKPTIGELLSIFGATFILAAFTIYVCRRQQRTWPASLGWAVLVFFFGLPGLLTFRLASDWPIRQRCPSCQKRRPIETHTCPACAATWPVPKLTGREVFEAQPQQATA
jgi:hypothetical protein